MVDDRYDWLDEETAEQLLRGLPVDARCDGPEARLAAALRSLRPAVPAAEGGELPGEATAVAAYHAERPAAADAGRLPRTLLGRMSAVCRPPVRSAGRPLRAGLAVAVAGFALGGVAVAAGVGVLPTPFHDGPTGPAVSVSPMGGPSSGDAGDAGGTDGSSEHPGTSAGSPGGRTPGGPDAVPGATPTPDGGRDGGDTARHRNEADGKGDTSGLGSDLSEVDQEALVDSLCSAYTHHELNAGERRRLERAAGGEQGVGAFCAEHGVTAGENTAGGLDTGGDGTAGGQDGHRGKDETLSGGVDPGGAKPGDGDVPGGVAGGAADGAAGGGGDHAGGTSTSDSGAKGDTDADTDTDGQSSDSGHRGGRDTDGQDGDGQDGQDGQDGDGQDPSGRPSASPSGTGSPSPTPSASASD